MIEVECSPSRVAHLATVKAAELCKLQYGRAPLVQVIGDTEIVFSYVPAHLNYIFTELLKNSMRAGCEHHKEEPELPAIQIVLAEGDEDVSVKISDRGGGFARDGMKRIWTYAYTTAPGDQNAIAGFGDGLPTARLYARYFGGDLKMMSMQGC